MGLSEIGKKATTYWCEIPEHFPLVILNEFVVMPNHVHGIIEIAKTDVERTVETQDFASLYKVLRRDAKSCVSTITTTITHQNITKQI